MSKASRFREEMLRNIFVTKTEKNRQFALAKQYLAGEKYHGVKLPRGNKLGDKFTKRLKKTYGKTIAKTINTTVSFYNINGQVYALLPKLSLEEIVLYNKTENSYAGEGGFGKAKFVMNEDGEVFILKIEHKQGAREKRSQKASYREKTTQQLALEKTTLTDQGILLGDATKIINEPYYPRKKLAQELNLMPYLGEDLSTHFGQKHTLDDKLDIAIQIAWRIHQLHSGYSSLTATPTAHLDIKPENITIDEQGRIHLVDFGLAIQGLTTPNGDKKQYPDGRGTSGYCPPNVRTSSLENGDLYALKQTLWMTDKHFRKRVAAYRSLLPVTFFNNDTHKTLKRLLTTDSPGLTASYLAALLSLSTIQLDEALAEKIQAKPELQQAIIVLHYASKLTDYQQASALNNLLDNAETTRMLSSLAPIINLLPKTFSADLLDAVLAEPINKDQAEYKIAHYFQAIVNQLPCDPNQRFYCPRLVSWYYNNISDKPTDLLAFINDEPRFSIAMALIQQHTLSKHNYLSAVADPGLEEPAPARRQASQSDYLYPCDEPFHTAIKEKRSLFKRLDNCVLPFSDFFGENNEYGEYYYAIQQYVIFIKDTYQAGDHDVALDGFKGLILYLTSKTSKHNWFTSKFSSATDSAKFRSRLEKTLVLLDIDITHTPNAQIAQQFQKEFNVLSRLNIPFNAYKRRAIRKLQQELKTALPAAAQENTAYMLDALGGAGNAPTDLAEPQQPSPKNTSTAADLTDRQQQKPPEDEPPPAADALRL